LAHAIEAAVRALVTRARAREALVRSFDDGRSLRAGAMRCADFKRDALDALLANAGDPSFGDATLLGRILTAELALTIVDAGLGA
jgi:hypothetical protein